jgi:hypothetical protein
MGNGRIAAGAGWASPPMAFLRDLRGFVVDLSLLTFRGADNGTAQQIQQG